MFTMKLALTNKTEQTIKIYQKITNSVYALKLDETL